MAEVTNPHDRFFKELLGQPAIADEWIAEKIEGVRLRGVRKAGLKA
jgi:hypothetical protein